ncbi:rRNA methyltransferase [Alkalihalobacillus alcalophilus ATCC 27647 = CGMCC 1.3604]|uniref:rRNA methyltransferase n=1 Tax=Alkalihalobacillus alcalophilus ATCC 27647 = CGMCC 1.3604 TaxID=1218173 RepID=A0A094XJ65_ALKAL|nr:class I SAM-dependent methyltransferase [Alkalihalobacillus alcalophilus]KGA98775.1 rRNA methyltransferase [Alkalihalobacillus alcalophilus ATCC 27647 = CGMCC 1.3604]MED1560956.1 class I SAM-dependent methyltransferase [Alkalihalobacillus alcalophilus]THG90505.1 rRNA methyltransferase [Alkalihalobacillus alcalophilus ATCC 27647 = CGMCC 1.3604]
MRIAGILPFARNLLAQALKEGDIAIDCTAGKGNDTITLAKLVGSTGHVYSFDIQEEAIKQTAEKVKNERLEERVTLFQQGHEIFEEVVPTLHLPHIKAAIFNLGYLPGGNKTIVTKPESTLKAIQQLLKCMPKEGLIVLVIYHGHKEGKLERDSILNFVTNLDQNEAHVLNYRFINQKNDPPFIVAIEKR